MLVLFKLVFAFFGTKAAVWFDVNPIAGLGIGLFVGHILDHAAATRLRRWRVERIYKAQAKRQFDEHFIESLFLMLGKICIADGVVSKREIANVEYIMTNVLSLDRKSRKRAIEVFRSVRHSQKSFQSCAVQFFELYQSHPEMFDTVIALFFNLATCDGGLDDREERMIHTAAMVFGVEEERYQRFRNPYARGQASGNGQRAISEVDRSYSVLGCKPDDSDAVIKRSYRKLVSEYHPDKIVSKDLPEEFIKFANEKFKNIQEAYDCLKQTRGLS